MIRSFYTDSFKPLMDFRLPPEHGPGQFTCVVGLNGAGKPRWRAKRKW